MPGPISQTSGASGIFARSINLAGAANAMRLVKIANRSDDDARCGLSNAPTPEFQSGLGKAMRACCGVIEQEYVDAGSKDKVKFAKAMEWLEGQGAGELGPKVLNEMTALGASYAALRHLCDATPADELHIKWKDQIQGAIVSSARRIGACKTPPSGDYMGDPKTEAVADALKEAGDRLVECFKEVGGQTLVEATVASLLAEPMYLAIKKHHGERVASEFVEGGACQRRIEQVLHKQELSNVQDAVRDQLALKTFAGVQGAIEAVLKLPALVVDPQTAKDATKAPTEKQNPLPKITPEIRDLARSGSGINIAQNINNFDDMANAIRETGNSADLVNAIVNAFKEGFAMGQKEGRLGERLTHIENRNSELEKQNQALRDQLRVRSHSPDLGFGSTSTVLSEDAQSGIYENPDSRLRANEPTLGQGNDEGIRDVSGIDQRMDPSLTVVSDDASPEGFDALNLDGEAMGAGSFDVGMGRMPAGGPLTDTDDSAFSELRRTLDSIGREERNGALRNDAEVREITSTGSRVNQGNLVDDPLLTSGNESRLDDAPTSQGVRSLIDGFEQRNKNSGPTFGSRRSQDLGVHTRQNEVPSRRGSVDDRVVTDVSSASNHGESIQRAGVTLDLARNEGNQQAGPGEKVARSPIEEFTPYIRQLNTVGSPNIEQRAVIHGIETDVSGQLKASYSVPWSLPDRAQRTVAPSDVIQALKLDRKPVRQAEEKREQHELIELNRRFADFGDKSTRSLLSLTKQVAEEFRERDGAAPRRQLVSDDVLHSRLIRGMLTDKLLSDDLADAQGHGTFHGAISQAGHKQFAEQDVRAGADHQQAEASPRVGPASVPSTVVQDKPFAFPDSRDRSFVNSTLGARAATRPGNLKRLGAFDVPALIMSNRANEQGHQQKNVISMLNSRGSSVANTDISSSEESDSDTGVPLAIPRPKHNHVGRVNEFGLPLVDTVSFP